MSAGATILVWLVLMLLLGLEFLLARFGLTRGLVPGIGVAMALLVAMRFMRLQGSRGLVPVFALAGAFWLCIMFGLGSLDSFTRHDILLGQPLGEAASTP